MIDSTWKRMKISIVVDVGQKTIAVGLRNIHNSRIFNHIYDEMRRKSEKLWTSTHGLDI
jgi:hypothetical protein